MMDKQSMEKYNYAFLDEGSKREIRRSVLKAVAIPGSSCACARACP